MVRASPAHYDPRMTSSASASEHDLADVRSDGAPAVERFDIKPDASNHFAWIRTRLALERTMMAWLRTATSLIAFGFTIFQVMQRLNEMKGVKAPEVPEAPRYLCLALIGAGVIACAIAVVEYRSSVRYLFGGEFRGVAGMHPGKPEPSVALPLAVLLLFVGVFAFLAVLLRAS
jgi:putative membrane protein